MKKGNLFTQVNCKDSEFIEELLSCKSESLRIERIISEGDVSPVGFWYDQNEFEFVAVIQGSAKLEFTHEIINMNPGDWVLIPAHERHRVIYTSNNPPCVWFAVFGVE